MKMREFWDKLTITGRLGLVAGIMLVGLVGLSLIDMITSSPSADKRAAYCAKLAEEIAMLEKDTVDFGVAADAVKLQYQFYQARLARYRDYPAEPELTALQMNHPMVDTSSGFIVVQSKLQALLERDRTAFEKKCSP